MNKSIKLFFLFSVSFLIISLSFFLATLVNNPNEKAHAQNGGLETLGGYGWSDNIGWISFSGSTYSTTVATTTGLLNGYAWSDNIGWLKFGGFSGFPSGSGSSATNATFDGNAFNGWARFCAGMDDQLTPPPDQTTPNNTCTGPGRQDGWDGWISTKGSGYGVQITNTSVSGVSGAKYLTGYMWGSDVVGWIDMSQAYVVFPPNPTPTPTPTPTPSGSPTATPTPSPSGSATPTPQQAPTINSFTAIPPSVNLNSTCQLTWTGIQNMDLSKPGNSCTITGPGVGFPYSLNSVFDGWKASAPINASYRYTLTCTNPAGTASKQTTCNLKPGFHEE